MSSAAVVIGALTLNIVFIILFFCCCCFFPNFVEKRLILFSFSVCHSRSQENQHYTHFILKLLQRQAENVVMVRFHKKTRYHEEMHSDRQI